MLRTCAGYTGGSTPEPEYHALGDHTEALQLEFDPRLISYEQLLGELGAPGRAAWKRQYRWAIFAHSDEQLAIARRVAAPFIDVERAGPFYRAEGYHQKYRLRRLPWLLERAGADFVDSTLGARLNALAGGHLKLADLEAELGPQPHLHEAAARLGAA